MNFKSICYEKTYKMSTLIKLADIESSSCNVVVVVCERKWGGVFQSGPNTTQDMSVLLSERDLARRQ